MSKFLYLFLPILLLLACKDKKASDENALAADGNTSEMQENGFPVNPLKLPDPCSLFDEKDIQKVFGLETAEVEIHSGNKGAGQGQENTNSCFITWEKDGGKTGFVVQLMKNPMYGEFDKWASSYLEVLRTAGETSYPDNKQFVYTPVEGLGNEAVYNAELGKLFWRKGDELVFGLIFRSVDDVSEFLKQSKALGSMMESRVQIEK